MQTYGATDIGKVRESNQDCFLVHDDCRTYAVADGMGGLPHGDVASKTAIEVVSNWLEQHLVLRSLGDFQALFTQVQKEVLAAGGRVTKGECIGTTLTVAQLKDKILHVGHIGDSGVAIFNKSGFKQVTEEHTIGQQMVEGVGAHNADLVPSHYHDQLTKCIGIPLYHGPDYHQHALELGERIVLYTDGVSKILDFEKLHPWIMAVKTPKTLVDDAIALANHAGAPDNVTMIALFP